MLLLPILDAIRESSYHGTMQGLKQFSAEYWQKMIYNAHCAQKNIMDTAEVMQNITPLNSQQLHDVMAATNTLPTGGPYDE